jgi:ribosome-associated protein
MPDYREDEDRVADEPPSKSARKRQMLSLQAMGESLLDLNDRQLARIPIDDERLITAIRECRLIHSKSARKRHLQFIGKLMRDIDPTPIEQALAQLRHARQHSAHAFHQLEQLRADILSGGVDAVELAMVRFPGADRQHLRQLVLQHQREMQREQPPAASRKLFRYLKELQDSFPQGS